VQNFDVTGIDSGQDAQPPADVPPMDRRIADVRNFADGLYPSDVVCFNHAQNVYIGGPAFGPDIATHREMARQLSLSMVYWLQNEAPRLDGGQGYPDVRLRPDVVGTEDGLAMAPYIRESRRIRAELTVREQDITGEECDRQGSARRFDDSVGIMHYFIDMWPSTEGKQPFLLPVYPAQIPMGSLIPVHVRNLLPACKNAGLTQITASAYRMHPGEWAIGEGAGALAAYCIEHDVEPQQVRGDASQLARFQSLLERMGIATRWPGTGPLRTWESMVTAWRQFGRMDRSVLLSFPH
jgi:hypothetical protein